MPADGAKAQDWRYRHFIDMAREWRQHIWRGWVLLGGDRDEAVGLIDIS